MAQYDLNNRMTSKRLNANAKRLYMSLLRLEKQKRLNELLAHKLFGDMPSATQNKSKIEEDLVDVDFSE